MLSWEIENGIISNLTMGKDQLINPWGVETADSWGFFSLEKNIGYRHFRSDEETRFDHKDSSINLKVEMPEGNWRLSSADSLKLNSIVRTVRLQTLTESWFMDFVLRFRFKKSHFDFAEIAGQKIYHQDSNVYHQYPVREVWLHGPRYRICLKMLDVLHGHQLSPYMYVRDFKDEWVVHIRLLPSNNDRLVIKLCNQWSKTKPLSPFLNEELLKKAWVKKNLLYRSERQPYKNKFMRILCPNAFPLINLAPMQELFIKAECIIYEK